LAAYIGEKGKNAPKHQGISLMRLITILPALLLALSACSHASNTAVQPPPMQTAPAKKAELLGSRQQTFTDKAWSLSLPSTFVRNVSRDGWLDADDKTNGMSVFLSFSEFGGDQMQAAQALAMSMAAHEVDVQSIKPGSFAGQDDAIVLVASKDTSKGTIHFKSYSSIVDAHIYNFGCIVFPTSPDVDAAGKVCDMAAASVKLNPLPPAQSDERTPSVSGSVGE
jgi:hypothetical protein